MSVKWWTDSHNRQIRQPHEIIELPNSCNVNSHVKFAQLYKMGLSLKEVSERTGVPKSTIRQTLIENGIAIRDFKNGSGKKHDLTKVRRSGNTPFGYTYLEGQLVVDPKEYKVVLDIYRQWTSGKSYRAIARDLNDRGEPTRFGKSWKHEVIKNITQNHEDKLKKDKRR